MNRSLQIKSLEVGDRIRRLDKLIKHGYYYNMFIKYTPDEVLDVYDVVNTIDADDNYCIVEYFYSHIAKRTVGGRLVETYKDRLVAIALYMGGGNVRLAKNIVVKLATNESDLIMYMIKGYGVIL